MQLLIISMLAIGLILYLSYNYLLLFIRVPDGQVCVLKRTGGMLKVNEKFPGVALKKNEVGIIPEVSMSNQWIIKFPKWKFNYTLHQKIEIPEGEIGLIIARHGNPKPVNRKLSLAVECNSFQNARFFFDNGGQKGVQSDFLREGDYFVNLELFKVITTENVIPDKDKISKRDLKLTRIDKHEMGIVTTEDGKPLEDQIAGIKIDGHNKFTDATTFINNKGFRGLQIETIPSGVWPINPWFAKVEKKPLVNIPNDRVGVLISSYGKESFFQKEVKKILDKQNSSIDYEEIKNILDKGDISVTDKKLKEIIENDYSQKDYEKLKSLLVEEGYKGVMRKTLNSGIHRLNTDIYKVELVPTNQIILEWHDRKKEEHRYDYGLESIPVFTKDRHKLLLEVTQTIRIDREEAPVMTLTVGAQGDQENQGRSNSIKNLVTKVLSSVIHNEFVAAAAAHDGIDFIDETRSEIQTAVSLKVSAGLKFHGVVGINTTFKVVQLSEELQAQIDQKKKFANEEFEIREKEKLEAKRIASEMNIALQKMKSELEISKRKIFEAESIEQATIEKEMNIEKLNNEATMQKLINEKEKDIYKLTQGVKETEIIAEQNRIRIEQDLYVMLEKAKIEGGPQVKILEKLIEGIGKTKFVPDIVFGNAGDYSSMNHPYFPMYHELMQNIKKDINNEYLFNSKNDNKIKKEKSGKSDEDNDVEL